MNSKWFLTSKTVLGALLAGAVPVAALLGFDLGAADKWMGDILTLAGACFAIYGRVKAVKRLKLG